jgi:hypothetical protein
MKKIILPLGLFVSKALANPTSGWNEDYSYGDYTNTGWSLGGDPIFWGLVLIFGILLIPSLLKDLIKPDPNAIQIKTSTSEKIGCLIPVVIMVVLAILFFIGY